MLWGESRRRCRARLAWMLGACALGGGVGCTSPLETDGESSAQVALNDTYPNGWVAPQIQRGTGPVMEDVTIVPYFIDDDPYDMDGFVHDPRVTAYLLERLGEYGVRTITVADGVPLSSDKFSSDEKVRKQLVDDVQQFNAGLSTLHVFFPPPGKPFEKEANSELCKKYSDGYRWVVDREVSKGRYEPLVYAVIGQCEANLKAYDSPTDTYVHEVAEAITDPLNDAHSGRARDGRGYRKLNPLTAPTRCTSIRPRRTHKATRSRTYFHDGHKISDICNEPKPDIIQPHYIGGWRIPRLWSNASAETGDEVCLPRKEAGPYVNTAFLFPNESAAFQIEPSGGPTYHAHKGDVIDIEAMVYTPEDDPAKRPSVKVWFEMPNGGTIASPWNSSQTVWPGRRIQTKVTITHAITDAWIYLLAKTQRGSVSGVDYELRSAAARIHVIDNDPACATTP